MERFSAKTPLMAGFIAQMGNTTVGVDHSVFIVDLIITTRNSNFLAIWSYSYIFCAFATKRATTLKEMTTKTDQLVFAEHIVGSLPILLVVS